MSVAEPARCYIEQPREVTERFLDAATLSAFLSDAGLAIEQQFGDWDRRPLRDTSPEIITMARRSVSLVRKF
jgi:hypothetical protein